MSVTVAVLISASVLGADDPAEPASKDEQKAAASARLDFMKDSVAGDEITRGEKEVPLKLLGDPVLRWKNPVSDIPDGALFLWVGREGRPQVAAQAFIAAGTKDLWLHEFSSLSTEVLQMTRNGATRWNPQEPGIEFRKVEDPPASPLESSVRRLAQMRSMAQEFKAGDDFDGKTRSELRLLAKPLYRYGKENSEILDGALFALAHGTDPEVFIVIEARRSQGKYEWYYGLAPMTPYALKVTAWEREVWSAPYRKTPYDPGEPFLVMQYRP